MASHVSGDKIICGSMGYRKAEETCERLESFRPAMGDDDSRVTGDQWREMSKELLVLEKDLADTKALLHGFYRAVTPSTMDFDEESKPS